MKISSGIAITTHIDRHYEQLTKSALDGMAEQIKEKFIPQLIEHDWKKHVGVVLYGEVFQLDDGEYALGIVSGIFENEEERTTYATGKPNIYWREYKKYLDINKLIELAGRNKTSLFDSPVRNVADLLETNLDSTEILPDGTVYKIKRFIAATGDLRIEVYPKDHKHQPHFHVISKQRNINARFDIQTLEHITSKNGKIKPEDIKRIQHFFKTYPEYLEKLKTEHSRFS
jgi:hypothetical protein